MRIAVVSDIHGNITALDAVIADLKQISPDVVVHGGDLLGAGARQADVIDRIRDLGWPGVYGNADEMLWDPGTLSALLRDPAYERLLAVVSQHATITVEAIGPERLTWLRSLPMVWREHGIAVVHASPTTVWHSPRMDTPDEEVAGTYSPLQANSVVYGHVHTPFVRRVGPLTVANAGSVSLSYDGDWRASYVVVDGERVTFRRVAYDIEREIAMMHDANFPHTDWVAAMLRQGLPLPPPED